MDKRPVELILDAESKAELWALITEFAGRPHAVRIEIEGTGPRDVICRVQMPKRD